MPELLIQILFFGGILASAVFGIWVTFKFILPLPKE